MSRASLLRAGRRAAERGMTDTVEIYEVTEAESGDGLDIIETETVHYRGPGKIQFFDAAYEQSAVAGAHTHVIDRSFLHVPHDTTAVAIDRYVRVVASGVNPRLIGRKWRIANFPDKSQATALRLPIEEVLQ